MSAPHISGARTEQAWSHRDGRRALDRVPARGLARVPAVVATGSAEIL
jgi:hypothetical protein